MLGYRQIGGYAIETQEQPPLFGNRPFAESIGIKIVPIRAGADWMGSSPEQVALVLEQYPGGTKEFLDDEQPRHRVQITKLQGLSAHEITVGQFRCFVEDAGYQPEVERDTKGGVGFDAVAYRNVHPADP